MGRKRDVRFDLTPITRMSRYKPPYPCARFGSLALCKHIEDPLYPDCIPDYSYPPYPPHVTERSSLPKRILVTEPEVVSRIGLDGFGGDTEEGGRKTLPFT